MTAIAKNLKLIRLIQDKTQPEFGKMFNATKSMISSYEKAKAEPDSLFITRVAKFAGVTEGELRTTELNEASFKWYKGRKERKDGAMIPVYYLNEDEAKNLQKAFRFFLYELAKIKAKLWGLSESEAFDELQRSINLFEYGAPKDKE